MARALFLAALALAFTSVTFTEARSTLWGKGRDKVNVNTAGSSDYIASLQKLKHMSVEHHSLVPPHIRTVTGAFNIERDDKVFNDLSADLGVTSLLTEDVPYWSFQGSAVVTDDYVRLTPNRQSQQGGLWNLEPLDLPSFELRVGIRVHSRANVGADGMAVWIVDEIPTKFGPTFGMPSAFHGLGILVDTYDNDANRDNPVISLIYNSERDKSVGRQLGVTEDYKNDVLGRCTVDFRNQADVTVLILKYRAPQGLGDAGSIELTIEKPGRAGAPTNCVTVSASQATLSIGDRNKRYYVGATAETGGMSDNHDVAFVAVLPMAGAEHERDLDALNQEERELRGEERSGERLHRYTHRKEKEDREYWRAKTPEEEAEAKRLAAAKAAEEEENRNKADEGMRARQEEITRLNEERNQQREQERQRSDSMSQGLQQAEDSYSQDQAQDQDQDQQQQQPPPQFRQQQQQQQQQRPPQQQRQQQQQRPPQQHQQQQQQQRPPQQQQQQQQRPPQQQQQQRQQRPPQNQRQQQQQQRQQQQQGNANQ